MEIKTLTTAKGVELKFPELSVDDYETLPLRIVDLMLEMEENPEDINLIYKAVRALMNEFLSKKEADKWLDISMGELINLVGEKELDTEVKK